MADARWARVAWPGLQSYRTFNYTMSLGIAPGCVCVRANPQSASIAARADMVIYDGVSSVVLADCKLDKIREVRGPAGIEWELLFLDRRWKWRDGGFINLFANQLDPQSKFIPWTVFSPREIAERCLRAMGETDWTIDLPVGLSSADAAGLKEFLPTGVNFPATGVNVPLNWFWERPANVLEQMCDGFGCVVAWQWKTNSVAIVQRGDGADLPAGSVSSRSPSIDDPEAPDGCIVVGSPTRYQMDLEVQAVGEDWDHKFRPIDDLSYAPLTAGQKHKVTWTGVRVADFQYYATIDGVQFGAGAQTGEATMAAIVARLAAQFTAHAPTAAKMTVTAAGDVMTAEAKQNGPSFAGGASVLFTGTPPAPANPAWAATVVNQGKNGRKGWSTSYPPLFPGVRATDRLTLAQARDLARKSVWRYYQLTGRDLSGKGAVIVPGVGPVKRKQQIVMLDTMCEQIVPDPVDFNIRLKDGSTFVQNQYDGYSRDKPAAAFGSVATTLSNHLYFLAPARAGLNTEILTQVQVDFSIDPNYQLVKFSGPVYRYGKGLILEEPDLFVRCACHVRDPDTNQFLAYHKLAFLGAAGGTPVGAPLYAAEKHDDVQLNVIPTYGLNGRITSINTLEADPINRADYYLAGMVRRYQVKASLVNEYNGIVDVQLDGAISQITWDFGAAGSKTTASVNYEHNTALPPYPARRRQEMLRAAVQPGGYLGQMVGARVDPTRPPPFTAPTS